MSSLPAWEVTQERTFARWCNQQLKHRNITIPDNGLCDEMASGANLCILLEELSKKSLKGVVNKPNTRFQQLSNNSIALKFIASENIQLAAIGPEDIVDKKRKLVMGLIWTLILRYQISKGAGGTSGKGEADSAKSDLLKWVQGQVEPYNVPVNNFGQDWSDGRVICALVNSLRPNTINMAGLNDPYDNAKQGIDAAETELLIPRIMEPDDFSNGNPDELSVVTYASYFRDAMNSRKGKPQNEPAPVSVNTKKGPVGSNAQVEVFLSLATSSTKVKKDIQSLKFLLDKKGVKYAEYDVGTNEAKKQEAFSTSGVRTLPQLFINGAYVGDYDAAQMLEETGELNKLLGH